MKPERATIVANGKQQNIDLPCSVADFLRHCGWQPTQVVVEHNGRVLARTTVETVFLKSDDHLEIIQPVAGG